MKLCSLFSFGLCYANNDLHTDGVLDLEGADFANMERKDQEKLLGKIFAKSFANFSPEALLLLQRL